EKSMEILELPRVLERLSLRAVTEEGKERCLALRPSADPEEVAFRLEQTTAAADMVAGRGSPPMSGIRPVRAALQRAGQGGSLNTKELLDVAAVLHGSRMAREYGDSGEEENILSPLFRNLGVNRYLEDAITSSVLGENEIADSASPELADIRRKIRAASSRARETLNKLLGSSQARFLQDRLITQRGGRFVVPVKAENKNEIPGLIHDVSGSGSTVFIEPMGVVKANNEIRELEAREEKEIERILAELSALCDQFREEIESSYELLVQLDCIFARAGLSSDMNGTAPEISKKGIFLCRARHPLLDPDRAVANDLALGEDFDTLVITGPNTGGKTVTLKTIGLLSLMAQCGLHIPAAPGSRVRVFSAVLADIGDEQSIDQSLSTFSAHMSNIVGILDQADGDTLILFDELGAGTDPVEGAALAAAIIDAARERGALVCATTHYAELKIYAMTTPGVENACCQFDVETLAPTYRLLMGVPGKSNAFAISRRLGLPQDIIDQAGSRMDAGSVRFEDVLTELEKQRQGMEEEREKERKLRLEMEQSAKESEQYRKQLQEQLEKGTASAKAESRQILEDTRREADRVFRELNEMRREQEKQADWREINDRRAALRHRINEAEEKLGREEIPAAPAGEDRPAAVGDTVELLSMGGIRAEVTGIGRDDTLELQAGSMKIRAGRDEVRVVGKQKKKQQPASAGSVRQPASGGSSAEVDLRGMSREEAVMAARSFLDTALMAKLDQVTLIHGKGTGAVRSAVRDYLKHSEYVKSFRPGRYGEGEDGVTVVELK
ncbi:MAG: endonuclease MutS2, partial [Oscillospiraceae bacterium]|nr:endonuclease MutS2 [Oscillospiraceae bacterium]